MSNSLKIALAVAVAVAVGLAGCNDVPTSATAPSNVAPAERATLSLVAAEQTAAEFAVDVHYNRDPARPGPRMMELRLQLSDGLTFVRAEPLAASELAGKELVAQPEADGVLRTLLYTTGNLHRLDSGPLMRLWFSGGGDISLVNSRPIFAPTDADQGLSLGGTLTVGGTP